MADTSNLSQFLGDVADAIRTKKGTTDPIPAANFDTEIESIPTGSVVEKVVVEANQIIEEETVVKIESTPITEPVVIPENGKAEVLADKTLLAENIGVTPEKIAKGNTILGIEGVAEGSGTEINNQDKTITTNGTYTADEGYTGLGTVTVNVPEVISVSNDVITFNSIAEAEAYTDFRPGDKAVIFDTVYAPLNIDTWLTDRFRQTFRLGKWDMDEDWYVNNTVTLPGKITFDEYVEETYKYLTKNYTGKIQLTMTDTSFTVIVNWNTVQQNTYVWSSTDGLTYTFSEATKKGTASTDEYISLNPDHEGVIALVTSALEKMAHIRYVNLFFSTRCTSAISGVWYADPAGDLTDTNGDFYPLDLTKCKFEETSDGTLFTLKKELVLFDDKINIYNKFITYPGESKALYFNLYEIDGVYYCGRNCKLYYSRETDKYYIGVTSSEYILQKYEVSTNTVVDMTPIFTETETDSDGNITTYYYYLEVPKTTIVYPTVKCSTEDVGIIFTEIRIYICENINANAAHTALYSYPLSGIYSDTELHKSDFGAYINPEDIIFGKTAIGNNGFVQGTLVIPDVTQTEVDETILVLNEILGGEA